MLRTNILISKSQYDVRTRRVIVEFRLKVFKANFSDRTLFSSFSVIDGFIFIHAYNFLS